MVSKSNRPTTSSIFEAQKSNQLKNITNKWEKTVANIRTKCGSQLYYEVHDYTDPWRQAPSLILQHGYGRSNKFWFNLIPYLSRHHKVICPDLRGLGQSSIPDPDKISLENY